VRVGWLQDDPGYIGGAELTAAEFRAAVPAGRTIVDCPPGQIDYDCDAYVCHNVARYHLHELEMLDGKRVVKYAHDVFPHSQPGVRQWFKDNAEWVFCSPLQREKMELDGEVIPPAMDLSGYKTPRQSKRRREGACSIAQWRNPGKGAQYVEDYARSNRPVDAYGPGVFKPQGLNVTYRGEIPPDKMAQTLWAYDVFVFLPFELEPFCRTVMEAHAAGCDLVINGLIGARHYLDNPQALDTAAQDFWEFAC
jgi:glycosyltransferase involved in cell wall biosynthesis